MRATLAIMLLGLVGASGATTRGMHYGELDDPGLLACDYLNWAGDADKARQCYQRLLESTPPAAIRAEAAWALGDVRAANTWFRDAVAAAPDSPSLRTRWGWLFAVTHQVGEAQALFNEALALDENDPYARLGLATLLAGSFTSEAASQLEPLLSDPNAPTGAAIRALLLMAWLQLENGDLKPAEELLDRADALLKASPWPPLELLALRAAAAGLADEPIEPWTRAALKLHPGYGDSYAVPAYFKVITRRYDQAGVWYGKALEIEPGNHRARLELGINLLRDNDLAGARALIEQAYGVDPFNAKTVNTLRLLDTLDEFSLRAWPPAAQGPAQILMRLHPDEADVIGPYLAELTAKAIEEFSARYRHQLSAPVVVELYPHHEDFAVRTVGLPGVGILGAAFGHLLAMDSPAARPPEAFHWGTTLWHEAAHVFTLKASEHRVTRWFSEGVSVFEEWRSGPVPGRHIPMNVLVAMEEDKFLPLAELDQGFVRPTYPDQVIVSYMQAGLVIQFFERRFGFASLVAILERYRLGDDNETALTTVLKRSMDELDEAFGAFVEAEFGETLAALEPWRNALGDARQSLMAEDWGATEAQAGNRRGPDSRLRRARRPLSYPGARRARERRCRARASGADEILACRRSLSRGPRPPGRAAPRGRRSSPGHRSAERSQSGGAPEP